MKAFEGFAAVACCYCCKLVTLCKVGETDPRDMATLRIDQKPPQEAPDGCKTHVGTDDCIAYEKPAVHNWLANPV